MNKQFVYAAKKLNLEKNYFTYIQTYTYKFIGKMNVSLKAIMKRVGHTDEKTTIQIYTHITEKWTNS